MTTLTATADELTRLWEEFKNSRDDRLREQLLLNYLPLVKIVAGRMKVTLPNSVEYDDLVGAGLVGLVNSIDNFDVDLGFKFETYAMPRIRGAVIDGLRDVDWLPRSYRRKARLLDRAVTKLMGEHGRPPNDHEIAAELGLEGEDYTHFLDQVGAASLVSLDVTIPTGEEGDSGTLHEVLPDEDGVDPLEQVADKDVRETVLKLIEELNKQERAVVSLYYYEELTFREIGRVLGVSESRVCQIHTRLISILRARLKKLTE